jgi:excinuclease ABC subunit B
MGRPVSEITGERYYVEPEETDLAADPLIQYMDKGALQKTIDKTKRAMEKAARELDFIEAARLRDEMFKLQKIMDKKEE